MVGELLVRASFINQWNTPNLIVTKKLNMKHLDWNLFELNRNLKLEFCRLEKY